MLKYLPLSLAVSLLAVPLCLGSGADSERALPVANPGFEEGSGGWTFDESVPMSRVTPEAARSGGFGLRVEDASRTEGSSAASERMEVEPGLSYRVKLYARRISGDGSAVFVRFYGENGRVLNGKDSSDFLMVQEDTWAPHEIVVSPPPGAVAMDVWYHSYNSSVSVTDVDDLSVQAFKAEAAPPWEPTYKIKADEVDRLTAADVPGPDGYVYPDWRMAGVQGGIPDVKTVLGPDAFEGLQGTDISADLNESVKAVAAQGGGAIELPAGEFYLDRPVLIRDSNIVIRGASRDLTRLIFRDHIPYGDIRLNHWTDADPVGSRAMIMVEANPKNLIRLKASSEGKTLAEMTRKHHWGNRFYLELLGAQMLDVLGPGKHILETEVEYSNGDTFTKSFELNLVDEVLPTDVQTAFHGAIMLVGPGETGREVFLAATTHRGENTLVLEAGHGLKVGDKLVIEAPQTPRWNAITGNVTPWGTFRMNQLEVAAVDADRVTVTQPVRIDFPVEDGAFVRKIEVIEYSGVESLTLEQAVITKELIGPRIGETAWYPIEDLWTDGINFCFTWNCWGRDLRVINACRHPLYVRRSKFCEVRDAEVDGALFKGGGGTAYVGFQRSFDGLMDSLDVHDVRHAPNVQWGAAGNVIRNSRFIGSDGQWHAGWTHENLYEGNVISHTWEDTKHGAYGHGLYASGPASSPHGPQGPRNVVYHNMISAPKDGLHMVGGNEAWLIMHNLFVIGEGHAVYGREKSFDHVIRGNVFVINKSKGPAIFFDAPNCTGIEVEDNLFYGPVDRLAAISGGGDGFERLENNEIYPMPAGGAALIGVPRPAVESIFEWQRSHQLQAE